MSPYLYPHLFVCVCVFAPVCRQALAIIEPFFKLMADGVPGVRIDNPYDVSARSRRNHQFG